MDLSPLLKRAADAREKAVVNRLVGEQVGGTLTADTALHAVIRIAELRDFVAEFSRQQRLADTDRERETAPSRKDSAWTP